MSLHNFNYLLNAVHFFQIKNSNQTNTRQVEESVTIIHITSLLHFDIRGQAIKYELRTMQVRVLDSTAIEYQLLSINRHIRVYYCTTETRFWYQEPKPRSTLEQCVDKKLRVLTQLH